MPFTRSPKKQARLFTVALAVDLIPYPEFTSQQLAGWMRDNLDYQTLKDLRIRVNDPSLNGRPTHRYNTKWVDTYQVSSWLKVLRSYALIRQTRRKVSWWHKVSNESVLEGILELEPAPHGEAING